MAGQGTVPSELTKRHKERIAAAVAAAAIAAERMDEMERMIDELAQPMRLNHFFRFLQFLVVSVAIAIILFSIYMLMKMFED